MKEILIVLGLMATTVMPYLAAAAASMRGNPDITKRWTGLALSFRGGIDGDGSALDACFE